MEIYRIVNLTIFLLFFIPYLIFIIYQLFWLNYIYLFQSGLLIIYGLITGILFNVIYGHDLPSFKSKDEANNDFNERISKLKTNIITSTVIGLIFFAILIYNISNIIILGCPSIGSPDGLRDIELLDLDKDGQYYYLHEIEEDVHTETSSSLKRDTQFISNDNVFNFYITRLCYNEVVLFYVVLFSLIYLFFLNFVTLYSYLSKITYWDITKSTRYHHFIFLLLHFIPFIIILFAQILFVYRVNMIYNGLLIPFGFVTGLLVSIMRTQTVVDFDRKHKRKLMFKITTGNRLGICLSSLLSALFVLIYIGKITYSFAQCTGNIPLPPHHFTNKMYTDFLILELCNNEYVQSIIFIAFSGFVFVLTAITLLLYIFYFKFDKSHIKNE